MKRYIFIDNDHSCHSDRHRHHPGFGRGGGMGFGGFREGLREGFRGRARRGQAGVLLLHALNNGPKHGYEIMKSLEGDTQGNWMPSAGSVYPLLQLLEDKGFVVASADGDRKVFTITDTGREELASRQADVDMFFDHFKGQEGDMEMKFIREEFEHLGKILWSNVRQTRDPLSKEKLQEIRKALSDCQEQVRRIVSN